MTTNQRVELVQQQDWILLAINATQSSDDGLDELHHLYRVYIAITPLWRACGYGAKVLEVCTRLEDRRKEITDEMDSAEYQKALSEITVISQ